jgi:hypothetical protein
MAGRRTFRMYTDFYPAVQQTEAYERFPNIALANVLYCFFDKMNYKSRITIYW